MRTIMIEGRNMQTQSIGGQDSDARHGTYVQCGNEAVKLTSDTSRELSSSSIDA